MDPLRPGDLLIVDDVPENLRVLAGILEQAGHSVRMAPSGAMALKAAAKSRPALILLDLRMPDMDGIETCRRLRLDPGLAEVPILFLSASDDTAQRLAAFAAGAVDFIPKPFDASEVLARVNAHLSISSLRAELARANAALAGQVRDESAARLVAEGSARDSGERLEMAMDAARMGTWVVRPGQDGLSIDARTGAILGVAAGDLTTVQALVDGFAADARAAIAAALHPPADGNAPIAAEGWWIRSPRQRRIQLRGRRSRTPDGGDRLVGLAWDVTAEHEMQRRLVHSEKMESLGRLAGSVAHDFRNHLSVVIGSADLIGVYAKGDLGILRCADSIQAACVGASSLIGNLLSFARRREVAFETLDLRRLLEESVPLIRSLLGKRIDFDAALGDHPLPSAVCRDQLQNALLNLCANARDALGDSGRLTLTLDRSATSEGRCRLCHEAIPPGMVRIRVADDGPGIPEDLQERIFEPFFTTKPEGKGTGLGLSTVVECMQQHKGHLTLSSRPGQGAAFCLYLPPA